MTKDEGELLKPGDVIEHVSLLSSKQTRNAVPVRCVITSHPFTSKDGRFFVLARIVNRGGSNKKLIKIYSESGDSAWSLEHWKRSGG